MREEMKGVYDEEDFCEHKICDDTLLVCIIKNYSIINFIVCPNIQTITLTLMKNQEYLFTILIEKTLFLRQSATFRK